jgi:hypothetical protein
VKRARTICDDRRFVPSKSSLLQQAANLRGYNLEYNELIDMHNAERLYEQGNKMGGLYEQGNEMGSLYEQGNKMRSQSTQSLQLRSFLLPFGTYIQVF